MRKGDRRRLTILETAEKLFYAKGYEQTSVQDILDELKLSKGGFYHHFESKLALLEEIVDQKCEASYMAAEEAVKACEGNAVDKLNAMFDKNGLWQNDSMDYIGLLIRASYQSGSVLLREKVKQISYERSLPLFNEIVREGIEQGLFYTQHPDEIGGLILLLGSNLTDEIAEFLAHPQDDAEDLPKILSKLEVYRYAIETLLNAPYGSIELYDLERMQEILQAIAEQNRRMAWSSLSDVVMKK